MGINYTDPNDSPVIQRFINYYNHERYYESLDNQTPADVYYGRGQKILNDRATIRLNTLAMRERCITITEVIYT
ncbi:MAG: hypothetical protein GY727_10170 [Gammaproteobacteria bacterium]|nr:hypothetical protein [Gammaproteobacteria bacterium]